MFAGLLDAALWIRNGRPRAEALGHIAVAARSGQRAGIAITAETLRQQLEGGPDPQAPARLARLETYGLAYDVVVRAGTAYVATGGVSMKGWLLVVDVSDPAAPILQGQYESAVKLRGAALTAASPWVPGQLLAYAVDSMGIVHVVDVSKPATPSLLGTYDTPGDTWGIALVGNPWLSGGAAYLADGDGGLVILGHGQR